MRNEKIMIMKKFRTSGKNKQAVDEKLVINKCWPNRTWQGTVPETLAKAYGASAPRCIYIYHRNVLAQWRSGNST